MTRVRHQDSRVWGGTTLFHIKHQKPSPPSDCSCWSAPPFSLYKNHPLPYNTSLSFFTVSCSLLILALSTPNTSAPPHQSYMHERQTVLERNNTRSHMTSDPTSSQKTSSSIIAFTFTYILLPTATVYLGYPYMVLRILPVCLITNKPNLDFYPTVHCCRSPSPAWRSRPGPLLC